jgi:hypothetical protein
LSDIRTDTTRWKVRPFTYSVCQVRLVQQFSRDLLQH